MGDKKKLKKKKKKKKQACQNNSKGNISILNRILNMQCNSTASIGRMEYEKHW